MNSNPLPSRASSDPGREWAFYFLSNPFGSVPFCCCCKKTPPPKAIYKSKSLFGLGGSGGKIYNVVKESMA